MTKLQSKSFRYSLCVFTTALIMGCLGTQGEAMDSCFRPLVYPGIKIKVDDAQAEAELLIDKVLLAAGYSLINERYVSQENECALEIEADGKTIAIIQTFRQVRFDEAKLFEEFIRHQLDVLIRDNDLEDRLRTMVFVQLTESKDGA